jgi:hypothetical protein
MNISAFCLIVVMHEIKPPVMSITVCAHVSVSFESSSFQFVGLLFLKFFFTLRDLVAIALSSAGHSVRITNARQAGMLK